MNSPANTLPLHSAPDSNGKDRLFAEIIIPLALPQNYTWGIPGHLQQTVKIGCRVEVQLRNKKYSGIIKRLHKDKPVAFEPREIGNVLDDEPLVHQQQLDLWHWIADYYMCSEGEVMNAAVPSNLKLSGESILQWNDEFGSDFSMLTDDEYLVAEALEIKKELRLSEVQQILDASHVYTVVKKLIDKKVCYIWEELKEKFKPKTETYIILNPVYHNEEKLADLLNNWAKAPRQLELVLAYLHIAQTEGEVIQSALLKKANATAAQLKGLIEKNILVAQKKTVNRLQSLPVKIMLDFDLSEAQLIALKQVNESFGSKQVCLLNGVTSSGKTQIYINLIEQFISRGQQVLYMLPEIALTAQIIRRLQKHFGGNIAVYHSKFNPNERVELWNKVKSGEIKAVLGARSALLLPFSNIGLIIVDEEHDTSYKQQEPAPRYHARDAAVYCASLFKAKVLLGSATPSVESYHNASLGKYALVELNERFGEGKLPETAIVDLKQMPGKDKSKVMLTPALTEGIDRSLQQKKQVILFQNRRGYAPYMVCNVCGWIPQCKYCDVTLTYHKAKNKLACHYCGTTYPVLQTCAACGSHNFIQKNFGTEKIEETIAETFPHARVARMDYDSIKGKNDHDNLIKLFEQQRVDILVGTQMVVKGLDFEHVNLVGIIDADAMLNFTDFRVNERAFQLMEQVSGRAGRKDESGKVLIQVSNTTHPVLQFVKHHDYKSLYHFEIVNRKNFFYPPFSRLIHITIRHKELHIAEEAANLLAHSLQQTVGNFITGPAEPAVGKIRNQYLRELLIKLPKDSLVIQECKMQLQQQMMIIQTEKRYRSVDIICDVDPI
ncbi:MAG TPA: primosomal protein N' [Panacibacter sp.]|nr:primosomal protein N' [Panacibacter sp.]HNP44874.1 primosomal protein N' [Panacibacter sp.]